MKRRSISKRNASRKKNYARSRKYAINGGSSWDYEDCLMVIQHTIKDIELAKQIGRSVQAIQGKRVKIKEVRNMNLTLLSKNYFR